MRIRAALAAMAALVARQVEARVRAGGVRAAVVDVAHRHVVLVDRRDDGAAHVGACLGLALRVLLQLARRQHLTLAHRGRGAQAVEDDHAPCQMVHGDLVPLQRASLHGKRVGERLGALDQVRLIVVVADGGVGCANAHAHRATCIIRWEASSTEEAKQHGRSKSRKTRAVIKSRARATHLPVQGAPLLAGS